MWYKVLVREFKYINAKGQLVKGRHGEIINIQRRSDEKQGMNQGALEPSDGPTFDNKEKPAEDIIEYPDFIKTEAELAASQAKEREDMGELTTEADEATAENESTDEEQTITSEDVGNLEDVLMDHTGENGPLGADEDETTDVEMPAEIKKGDRVLVQTEGEDNREGTVKTVLANGTYNVNIDGDDKSFRRVSSDRLELI